MRILCTEITNPAMVQIRGYGTWLEYGSQHVFRLRLGDEKEGKEGGGEALLTGTFADIGVIGFSLAGSPRPFAVTRPTTHRCPPFGAFFFFGVDVDGESLVMCQIIRSLKEGS